MRRPHILIGLGTLAIIAISLVWLLSIRKPAGSSGPNASRVYFSPSTGKAPPALHAALPPENEEPEWKPKDLGYYEYSRALEMVGPDGEVQLGEKFVEAFELTGMEQEHINTTMNGILKRMAAMMKGAVEPYELPPGIKWRFPHTTAFSIAGDPVYASILKEELKVSLAEFLAAHKVKPVLAGILKSAERSFIFRNMGAYDQVLIFGEFTNPRHDAVDVTYETLLDGRTIKSGSTRLGTAGNFYRTLFMIP